MNTPETLETLKTPKDSLQRFVFIITLAESAAFVCLILFPPQVSLFGPSGLGELIITLLLPVLVLAVPVKIFVSIGLLIKRKFIIPTILGLLISLLNPGNSFFIGFFEEFIRSQGFLYKIVRSIETAISALNAPIYTPTSNQALRYLTLLIPILFIYFSVKEFRTYRSKTLRIPPVEGDSPTI